MKRLYTTMLLICIFSVFANATPQFTSFTVLSNYLQNGKVKVYNNGTTTFLVHIGASRAISGSAYENVNMEVVFYVQLGSVQHTLKTVMLTSSHFNQHYLSTYNEDPSGNPTANNLVALDLPQNIERGEVRVKYRYKDSNNVWQPNTTFGYTTFTGTYYQTINLGSPYPPAATPIAPIYSVSNKGVANVNDIFQLRNTSSLPSGWQSYGVAFKAYTNQNAITTNGASAVYQYKYQVYDSNSQIADPEEAYFYSTSNSFTPTALAGYTYQFQSKTTLFYAFESQVANTIAILECRHKGAPIVVYKSSESEINLDMYDTSVAFYAYRWDQQ